MALVFKTNSTKTKVFNAKGTEISNIALAGTTLTVSGVRASIPVQGDCWPISAPKVGFVRVSDVKVTEITTPPPDPTVPPPAHIVLTEANGTVRFFDERLK
jgi:hypothetical protein